MSDDSWIKTVEAITEAQETELMRLRAENDRLRSTLEYVDERIHRIHWLAGLDEPIREQAQMAKDAIDVALNNGAVDE